MLNREKFLKQLGMNENSYCFIVGEKGDKHIALSFFDMLCDMVEMCIIIERSDDMLDFCKNMIYIKTIERATSLKWEDVKAIAEECSE